MQKSILRILLDSRFFGPKDSGLGIYAQNMIENLSKISPKDEFLILLKSKDFKNYKPKNKNVVKIECNIPHYSFKEQIEIPIVIKKYKPDLVHFFNFNKPIFYSKKNLVTFYDLTLLKHEGKKQGFLKKTGLLKLGFIVEMTIGLRTATKILSISNYSKNELVRLFKINPRKITTILLGYNNSKFSPIKDKNDWEILGKYGIKKNYVLYIGNDRPHKNLKRLVLAWEKLSQGIKESYDLVLAGKIDREGEIEKLLEEKKLKNVLITGFIEEDEKPVFYRNAKLFVFPSLSEGFGLPIIEAMASGTLVVCSNSTSLPEAGGEFAIYFDPENIEQITFSIERGLKDVDLSQSLVKGGLEWVKNFTWENTAKKTYSEYIKVFEQ